MGQTGVPPTFSASFFENHRKIKIISDDFLKNLVLSRRSLSKMLSGPIVGKKGKPPAGHVLVAEARRRIAEKGKGYEWTTGAGFYRGVNHVRSSKSYTERPFVTVFQPEAIASRSKSQGGLWCPARVENVVYRSGDHELLLLWVKNGNIDGSYGAGEYRAMNGINERDEYAVLESYVTAVLNNPSQDSPTKLVTNPLHFVFVVERKHQRVNCINSLQGRPQDTVLVVKRGLGETVQLADVLPRPTPKPPQSCGHSCPHRDDRAGAAHGSCFVPLDERLALEAESLEPCLGDAVIHRKLFLACVFYFVEPVISITHAPRRTKNPRMHARRREGLTS